LRDNASLLLFRIGLGYGSVSFPIEPCLFLMFFLLSALLMAPHAGFARAPFDDIQSHQASADIEAVYGKGIMLGTGDNKFSPDEF